MPEEDASEDGSHIIKLNNIRKTIQIKDILELFSNCKIKNGEQGIHITAKNPKSNFADAYIELESDADVSEALKKNNHFIGASTKQAKVTVSDKATMEAAMNNSHYSRCVLIRNFSLTTTKSEDIVDLFADLGVRNSDVVLDSFARSKNKNSNNSIMFLVRFQTEELADEALKKDRSYLKNRCIRVLPCSENQFMNAKKFLRQRKITNSSNKLGSLFAGRLKEISTYRFYHTDVRCYYSVPETLENKKFMDVCYEEGKILSVSPNFGIKWDGFNKIFNNIGRNDYNSNLSHISRFGNFKRSFYFYSSNSVCPPICSRNTTDNYLDAEADSKLISYKYDYIPTRLFGKLDFPNISSLRPEKKLVKLFRIALKL